MSTFLQQLQAQPWYSQVAAVFQQAGVPAEDWEATLQTEDRSLNPSIAVQDHYEDGSLAGTAYGLFQLEQPGLGSNYSAATLENPVQNATIAANVMAAALAKLPQGVTLSQQLQAIERAGWPGDLGEDGARQSSLRSILQQEGQPTSAATAAPGTSPGVDSSAPWWLQQIESIGVGNSQESPAGSAATNAGATAQSANAATANAATSWYTSLEAWANTQLLAFAIGAFFLALLAGGFAIMASEAQSDPTVQDVEKGAALAAA